MIVILLSSTACKCSNKKDTNEVKLKTKISQDEHAKPLNNDSLFYKGLFLQIDKPLLKGLEREFTVNITTAKINIVQTPANQEILSKKFKLRASIIQQTTVSTQGSQLLCRNFLGQLQQGEELTNYLTFAEIHQLDPNSPPSSITFQIQPHLNATKVAVLLELFDGETEKPRITQTVTWENTLSKVHFEGLKDIEGNNILEFSIRNDSEDFMLSGTTLNLLSTDGTSFTLNGKLPGIPLQDLLVDGVTRISKGQSTTKIQLQLFNDNAQHTAELTLIIVRANNQIIASEKIKWRRHAISDTPLAFIGLKDIHQQDKLSFYIENQDNKRINTDDIELSIAATNGITFTINGKSDNKGTLSYFLNNISELYKGHVSSSLALQVQNAYGQKESALTLTLKQHNGQEIIKTIKWYAKELQLSFKGLNNKPIVKGNQTLNFTIINDKDPIHMHELKVFANATNGTSVTLNNVLIPSAGISLKQIIQNTSSVLNKGDTVDIGLQIQNQYSAESSTITVQLKHASQFWNSSEIIWKENESKVRLQNFPENKLLCGKDDFSFQIRNAGDRIRPGEFYIQAIFNEKIFKSLQFNGINVHLANDKQQNLIDLADLATFNANSTTAIHGKVDNNNVPPSTRDEQYIILKLYQVKNGSLQERVLIQEKKIVWECPKLNLDFTIHNTKGKELVLAGNERGFNLQVTNTGALDTNIDGLFLYCKKRQGRSEIYKFGSELPIIENGQSTSIIYLAGNIFEIEHIKRNKNILLPLTIVPNIDDPIEYEFQLGFIDATKKKCLLPKRITVRWYPKLMPLQLKTTTSQLRKGNSAIKLSLLKTEDSLKWLAAPGTEDKVYLRIERKEGKHAEIYLKDGINRMHRTLLKKNQRIFLQPIAGLESIPLNKDYKFPTFYVQSHRDKQEEFEFSLIYIYRYRSQVSLERLINGPVTVAWIPATKIKNKKSF
jgi:hypothetical protein